MPRARHRARRAPLTLPFGPRTTRGVIALGLADLALWAVLLRG